MENMRELKQKYNAWLVIKDKNIEDWNCAETVNYLVFTEEKILVVGLDWKAKELKKEQLFLYVNAVQSAYNQLDQERQEKLKKYLDAAIEESKEFYQSLSK